MAKRPQTPAVRCLVPRLPPGNLHDLQAPPENRGGASRAMRSQAGAWEREWCRAFPGGSLGTRMVHGSGKRWVWFPGSRLGTSMIYRLRLKAEAEPRLPCVHRREPGNENGARVGKKVATTTIGEISWTAPSLPIGLVPRLPPGNLHDLQAPPESRGRASAAMRSQAGAWEREWRRAFPGGSLGRRMVHGWGKRCGWHDLLVFLSRGDLDSDARFLRSGDGVNRDGEGVCSSRQFDLHGLAQIQRPIVQPPAQSPG